MSLLSDNNAAISDHHAKPAFEDILPTGAILESLILSIHVLTVLFQKPFAERPFCERRLTAFLESSAPSFVFL